jgi:copper chaperone CopZ
MRKILMMLLLVMTAATMTAKDIRTLVLTTTPQMHCKNCENRVKNNLKTIKGIKAVETSVADQTVTIQYNAKKVSEETLINAFSGFGFTARKLAKGEVIQKEAHECEGDSEGGECKE